MFTSMHGGGEKYNMFAGIFHYFRGRGGAMRKVTEMFICPLLPRQLLTMRSFRGVVFHLRNEQNRLNII